MKIRVAVLAVLLALAGDFLGAAAGSRLGWEAAPALPSGAAAEQLKTLVFPGLTVWGGGDAELFVRQPDGEGVQYGNADYWVRHTPATRDVRAYTEGVRDRLVAAGWRMGSDLIVDDAPDAVTESHTVSFWATRDGLILDFADFSWPDRPAYDADGAAMAQLYRSEPTAAGIATGVGGGLGALLMLLLGRWAYRRVEDRPLRRRPAAVFTGLALFFLGVAALFSGESLGGAPIVPWWSGLTYLGLVPAVISALLALVVVIIAARPRRPAPAAVRRWRCAVALVPLILAGTVVVTWLEQAPPAWAGATVCRPSGPPAEPPAADVRLSREAFVYVSRQSTPAQRNLIEAAIGRVIAAGPGTFFYDPLGPEFRAAYCASAPLDPAIGRTLPYLFSVGLSSPGAFPALVAEVQGMPGVVAVRHALPDE